MNERFSRFFSVFFFVFLFTGCATSSSPNTSPGNKPLSSVAVPIPKKAPVVIVGAGLTGLTTAYELKKLGIRAIVLEASSRIGGRVQSVHFKSGNYAEGHMEEYWERSPAYALLRELGFRDPSSEKVLDPEKQLAMDVAHSSVRIDGKIIPYQGEGDRMTYLKGIFSDAEIKAFTAWNDKSWSLYQALHKAFFDEQGLPKEDAKLPADIVALQKISFKDYVAKYKLPRKVSEWIRVTVEPEMAIEWDKISALDGIDEFRLFFNTPEGFGEKNYHVIGGNTRFTDTLARQLEHGQILTNAQVTAIERKADGSVRVRFLKDGLNYEEIQTPAVVVTVPMYAIKNIQFVPSLSAAKQKAIQSTRFGAYIKVHFTVEEKAASLWGGEESVLTLLSDSPAGSIYEATDFQKSLPGKKPTNEVILTLLVHARFAHEMLRKNVNNDEMRETAKRNLDTLFPGVSKHILSAEIFSYPTSVAYWPLELKRSRFDELSQELRKPEGGIYIGGDTTEDSHSEGAIRAGLRMFKQLMKRQSELLKSEFAL